jgi:ABC-type transport system involved in multi-copper enzyme maturation permease subunit
MLIDVLGLFLVNNGNAQCNGPCIPVVPTGPGGQAVLDSFYFVRQPLPADGSLTVRLTSLTGVYEPEGGFLGPHSAPVLTKKLVPWSKAGIIITQGTRQGSAYAAIMVTGQHGVRMQYDYTADVAGLPGQVSAASPRWLRLRRSGDTITGYDSADGLHWTKVAAVRLSGLQANVQAGLFAASPSFFQAHFPSYAQSGGGTSPSRATGVFDHVSLRGGSPAGRWTGQLVGPSARLESMPGLGFQDAGGSFTITGTGDIAPIVGGAANTNYDTGTIADHLVAVIFGLTVLVVIGAMFVTAEYRRGMIRVTLAASPRRGRVLAAKALVVGLVSFVLGLPAAALAVFVGSRISRSHGVYVLPVTWAIELQVIAGTAALLALGAVLAVGIGTILRRSVAAVTTVIVVFVLPYILGDTSAVSPGVAEWIFRVTPVAGFAVQQSVPQYPQVVGQYGPPEYFPLAPWAGLAVLCAYAALVLTVACVLLRRRDA